MSKAKIFEGCKHPGLIDQYIQGVKDGAVEKALQAVAKEVEELEPELIKQQHEAAETLNKTRNRVATAKLEMIDKFKEIINNHLDNDSTN